MSAGRIDCVAIVGFGLMGSGIAQLLAQYGFKVLAADISEERLKIGLEMIRAGRFGLESAVQRGKTTGEQAEASLKRITVTTNVTEACKEADYIIENVFEDMKLKQEVFVGLDSICPPDTILATDTSSLSVTDIASAASRPERVIGMHFFNPAQVMNLVEIVRGVLTSDEAVEVTRDLCVRIGKTPIVVRDAPGFAAARLGNSLFIEASKVVEEGIASVQDVDTAMRLGFGHPMGPFELSDLIGLRTRLDVLEAMHSQTGEERWKPPLLLRQLVSAGYLGDRRSRKNSKGGYYDHFKIPGKKLQRPLQSAGRSSDSSYR